MAFYVGSTEVFDSSANYMGTLPSGNVIQIVNHMATAAEAMSGSLGASQNPSYTDGTSYTTFTFTPKSATSKLWLFSNTMSLYESTNYDNSFWVAAFYDTTRIQWVHVPSKYESYSNALNITYLRLNQKFNSWGTSQKTIDIRVGGFNSVDNMHCNRDFLYPSEAAYSWWGVTVMEILE